MSRTVDDLLEELRSQLDEFNTTNTSDAQLLATLNRGQRHAANITARKYEDLFWAETTVTTVAGQSAYDIPAEAFGRRIEAVSIQVGDIAYPVKRITNQSKIQYISSSQVTRPFYYTLTKNKLELYPRPAGGLTVNVYYNDTPEKLVKSQGRVTHINRDSNYILVDTVGEDLSTSTTGFSAYVNFVNYVTGEVKGTAQLVTVNSTLNQLTFKSASLTRATVLGKTVATSIPADLEVDDYVCLVTGTCVPELPDAYTDYLIQYAVVETRRRYGEPTNEEYAALKELETELLKIWSGRESASRVKKVSSFWRSQNGSIRRLLT